MPYDVRLHPDFVPEWKALEMELKEIVGEVLDHLEDDGPFWGALRLPLCLVRIL
jgi:mRNA-degrading endonuclease RelE of RelBE toxin-antitoxin system